MNTTLRINDVIYKEAKAGAAQAGITLTRFIEDALQLKLGRKTRRVSLPTYDSGQRLPKSFDLMSAIREAEADYSAKLAKKVSEKSATESMSFDPSRYEPFTLRVPA